MWSPERFSTDCSTCMEHYGKLQIQATAGDFNVNLLCVALTEPLAVATVINTN